MKKLPPLPPGAPGRPEKQRTLRSPLAGWLGGKSRLAKTIIDLMPEHVCYVEPFAGAAWVLFRKPPSKVEVLNDLNGEVANLYRVLQHHTEEFLRLFRWTLVSRDEFERLKSQPPDILTDIQRAARFFYIQSLAFAGRTINPAFATSAQDPRRLKLLQIEEQLRDIRVRLARVTVESLSYTEVIRRYDRPTTVFYLDPPYWGREGYYGKGLFCRDDYSAMAKQLASIKGKFLMSLNDLPEVRETFGSFRIDPVSIRYSTGHHKTVTELFIRNY